MLFLVALQRLHLERSWQSGSVGRCHEYMLARRYEAAKKKGDYDEEQLKREHAKNALERYMHYYQRW